MRAASVPKVNSAVQAVGGRNPARPHGARPPRHAASTLGRMGRFTRRSLKRFDQYTLAVFDPGAPCR